MERVRLVRGWGSARGLCPGMSVYMCICQCIRQVCVCVDVQMHSDTAAYVLVFTCV